MRPVPKSRYQFLLGSAFATVALVRAPAKAAQFEFKAASNHAPDHPIAIRTAQMWATVEQETRGRLHTQYFPNSQLGGDTAMFGQLRSNAIQFFNTAPGNLASVVPAADIGYLGFAYRDDDEALRVMNGPLGQFLRNEIAAKGMYSMRTTWTAGMNQIGAAVRPIRTPDDLKGFKIRIQESRILVDLFKALGASPTILGFSELYTGLQTHLVDGESAPFVAMEASKLYEVQKFASITNHAWSGAWILANADAWKSLPNDIQTIVERNIARTGALVTADVKAQSTSLAAKLTSQGMTIVTVDQTPFRTPLGGYYRSWADTFGPNVWGLLQTALGRKLT